MASTVCIPWEQIKALKTSVPRKGVSSLQQPFFLLKLLGLNTHSKDAFLAGEYDARKKISKFDTSMLGFAVLKFRKFEFRK